MLKLAPKSEVEGCKCEPVECEEVEDIMNNIVPDMIKILKKAKGFGLAAPQVGIKKQFFIVVKNPENMNDGFDVIFNSFYVQVGSRMTTNEGCLTYGIENTAQVKRFKSIRFIHDKYDEEKKIFRRVFDNIKGIQAIIYQHESDHLVGKTIFM